jgi:diguanylate cyclase (GGDEF)-like protein
MADSGLQFSFQDRLAAAEAAQATAGLAQAIELTERAATATSQPDQQAAAWRQQANLCMRAGRNEDAAAAYERACVLLEQAGEDAILSETLTDLTLIYVLLGLHEEALQAVGKSRAIAARLGDPRLLYWALNRTGVVHNSLGDTQAADAVMRDALALATSLGPHEKFCILNNIADNIHCMPAPSAAQLEEGISLARQALRFVSDGHHTYQHALALGNLGFLLALTGDFPAALTSLDEALALAKTHGHANLVLMTEHFFARVKLLQHEADDAIARLKNLLPEAERQAEKPVIGRIHMQLSTAFEATGDSSSALKHFKLAHAIEREYNTAVANSRTRMLGDVLALEKSKLEAARARLEAERLRVESAALELEKRELHAKANQDSLTGLHNRRYADTALASLFARAVAENLPLCVAICDLDRFKQVNDNFGHAVGDAVLRQTAKILTGHARASDLIARYGGEEFLIVFVNSELSPAAAACERLRAAIAAHPWPTIAQNLSVTISIGLTQADPALSPEAALAVADKRLYRAKQSGRDNVQVQHPEPP